MAADIQGVVRKFEHGYWVVETDSPHQHQSVHHLLPSQCRVAMEPGKKVLLRYESTTRWGLWFACPGSDPNVESA
ncbi:MAG: hypothetical protein AMS18_07120 [Gemmatimonas sp. SG8_17]|nr:MAG: hypothetical protein AMS18_07120 [Gemmatimonas sp. SG8_17]